MAHLRAPFRRILLRKTGSDHPKRPSGNHPTAKLSRNAPPALDRSEKGETRPSGPLRHWFFFIRPARAGDPTALTSSPRRRRRKISTAVVSSGRFFRHPIQRAPRRRGPQTVASRGPFSSIVSSSFVLRPAPAATCGPRKKRSSEADGRFSRRFRCQDRTRPSPPPSPLRKKAPAPLSSLILRSEPEREARPDDYRRSAFDRMIEMDVRATRTG